MVIWPMRVAALTVWWGRCSGPISSQRPTFPSMPVYGPWWRTGQHGALLPMMTRGRPAKCVACTSCCCPHDWAVQIMVKPISRSIMIYLLMRADLANAMGKPCLHTTKPSTMEIAAACVRVASKDDQTFPSGMLTRDWAKNPIKDIKIRKSSRKVSAADLARSKGRSANYVLQSNFTYGADRGWVISFYTVWQFCLLELSGLYLDWGST